MLLEADPVGVLHQLARDFSLLEAYPARMAKLVATTRATTTRTTIRGRRDAG